LDFVVSFGAHRARSMNGKMPFNSRMVTAASPHLQTTA
jgi:hypothetical protein